LKLGIHEDYNSRGRYLPR